MGDLEVTVDEAPTAEDLATLVAGLRAHNGARGSAEDAQPIAVFARRNGEVVGGADGRTHWGWLYVAHLWVAEELRGSGLGSQVLTAIESAGRARGAGAVWLDTFSFQAAPFYERLGYREFGRLDDFPPGETRHFLWKRL